MTSETQGTREKPMPFIHRYPSLSLLVIASLLGVPFMLDARDQSTLAAYGLLALWPVVIVLSLPIVWIVKGEAPTRAFWAGLVPLVVVAASMLFYWFQ